jgi:hypothetical protein
MDLVDGRRAAELIGAIKGHPSGETAMTLAARTGDVSFAKVYPLIAALTHTHATEAGCSRCRPACRQSAGQYAVALRGSVRLGGDGAVSA